MKAWSPSPARRQPPNARRDQFDRVAGRIAKVEGMTAERPAVLVLDDDSVCEKAITACVQVVSRDPHGEMTGSATAVWWQVTKLESGLRPKHQQDVAVANLKEDVPAFLLRKNVEAEQVAIKPLGLLEVIRVDSRFHKALDRVHGRSLFTIPDGNETLPGRLQNITRGRSRVQVSAPAIDEVRPGLLRLTRGHEPPMIKVNR